MINQMKLFFFGIFLLAFIPAQVNAHQTIDATMVPEIIQQGNGVFVHITAQIRVVKRSPNGIIAEILSVRQGKKSNLRKNEITGSMRLRGGKLVMRIDQKDVPVNGITLDNGLHLSASLSKKLGSTTSVVMSDGTTMVKQRKGESLLQFEIQ